MLPTSPLAFLNQPLAWFPFYLVMCLFVATKLLRRRRALPLATGLTNALHVGLSVAAWLVPVAGREYLGWGAAGVVLVTLCQLLLETPAPTPSR